MKKSSNALKLTLFLAIVAALATGVLALVNQMTAPVIADNASLKETQAYKDLYPEAKSIEKVEFTADGDGIVQEVYKIDDTAYAFKAAVNGYGGKIEYILGYNVDGSNSKYKVLSHSESAGFGEKIAKDDYISKFTGISSSDAVPVISGATVTSNAMNKATSAVITVFNSLTGNTGGPKEAEPEKATEILEEKADGDSKVYKVSSKGFGSEPNVILVKITEGKVESVTFETINDTPEYSDPSTGEAYLSKYNGLTDTADVDTATGATATAKSVQKGVQDALDTFNGKTEGGAAEGEKEPEKVSILEEKEDGSSKVYKISSFGFEPDPNIIVVKITDGKVDSVTFEKVADTPGMSDPSTSQEFLDLFNGLDNVDSVDAKTGATFTGDAVKNAVKKALDAFGGQ